VWGWAPQLLIGVLTYEGKYVGQDFSLFNTFFVVRDKVGAGRAVPLQDNEHSKKTNELGNYIRNGI